MENSQKSSSRRPDYKKVGRFKVGWYFTEIVLANYIWWHRTSFHSFSDIYEDNKMSFGDNITRYGDNKCMEWRWNKLKSGDNNFRKGDNIRD